MHRAAGLEVSGVWLQGQTTHVLTTLAILVKTPFRKSPATVGPSWHRNGDAGISLYGNGEARPHSVGMGRFSLNMKVLTIAFLNQERILE